jgi:hypothetical protein
LIDSTPNEKALENERNVRLIVLFDHEEVSLTCRYLFAGRERCWDSTASA